MFKVIWKDREGKDERLGFSSEQKANEWQRAIMDVLSSL